MLAAAGGGPAEFALEEGDATGEGSGAVDRGRVVVVVMGVLGLAQAVGLLDAAGVGDLHAELAIDGHGEAVAGRHFGGWGLLGGLRGSQCEVLYQRYFSI